MRPESSRGTVSTLWILKRHTSVTAVTSTATRTTLIGIGNVPPTDGNSSSLIVLRNTLSRVGDLRRSQGPVKVRSSGRDRRGVSSWTEHGRWAASLTPVRSRYMEDDSVENMLLIFVPRIEIAAIQIRAIRPSSRPYSANDAPSSFRRRRRRKAVVTTSSSRDIASILSLLG